MNEYNEALTTEEFLREIDIHELLPQQEPFVMIGTLTHIDPMNIITETLIDKDNIFVDNDSFSASGLMENIAQTCAARIGFVNKYILKQGIQIGFIGAVRNFEVQSLPQAGQLIVTHVEVKEEVLGMTLATATITCEGKTLVTTEMKIAVREDNEK